MFLGLPTDYAWVWYSILILFGEYLVLLIISIYAFDKIRFQVVSLPNEIDDEIDDHVIDSNNNNTTTTTINLRDISLSDLDDGGEGHQNNQQQQEHIVNDDHNFHTYLPIPSLEVSNEGINNDRLSIISSGDENNSKLLSPPSSPPNSILLNNTDMYDNEKHDIINNINLAAADNHKNNWNKVNSNDLTQTVSFKTPPSDGHMAFEPISFAFQDIWYKVKLATGSLLMMMMIMIIIMIVMMMMMIAMIVILYDK